MVIFMNSKKSNKKVKHMKKYGVYIPMAGYIYKIVESDTELNAIDTVFNEGYTNTDIIELDIVNKLEDGINSKCPEATAHEIEEIESAF